MQKNLTKKLVGTALFSALAFVISLLEFPIFGAVDFLKMDFSAVMITLSGFLFGPIYGITASLIKESIRFLCFSTTGGIGELANFSVTAVFILIPTIVYKYKKGIKVVIITMVFAILSASAFSLITNRFIMLPLFLGGGAVDFFRSFWYLILLFNVIKWTAVSIVVFFLYKRLSVLFKRI